jgi:cytochrome oxidase Cu insertion factor (SCO1/SenC/PrrC family)
MFESCARILKKCMVGVLILAASGSFLPAQAPKLPDVDLVDQDGHKVRFYTDLVRGRTVAIDFVFANCQTICPILGANFAKVNRMLGSDSSRFLLISLSVDPLNDTPASLHAYAARFGSGPSWRLLTGEKRNVDELLRALGEYTADKTAHSSDVLIGNGRSPWIHGKGMGSPADIVALMRNVR